MATTGTTETEMTTTTDDDEEEQVVVAEAESADTPAADPASPEEEEPESSVPTPNSTASSSSSHSPQQQQQQQQPEEAIESLDIESGPLPPQLELCYQESDDEEGDVGNNNNGAVIITISEHHDDGLSQSSSGVVQSSSSCCFGFSTICNRIKLSLCWAPTTPILATIVIPVLAIATHLIFAYGQIEPMWRLVYSAHVDVWANATSFEARSVFYTLGLDRDIHYNIQQDQSIRDFTYSFAINELWVAAGMPGKLLPRIAAVLLIIFSGVWPHLKLMLLTLTWFFSINTTRRTRMLHWLSTLGKWSLADVLVVCVMIGILHMDWNVDPTSIKQGLVEQVPLLLTLMGNLYNATDICSNLLHLDCDKPPSTFDWSKCSSCHKFVSAAMDHPETSQATFRSIAGGVTEGGSGFATLRVQGMHGIYAFCIAVILSIVLSLAVDVFDVRAKRYAERIQQHAQEDDAHHNNNSLLLSNDLTLTLTEPLLSTSGGDEEEAPSPAEPAAAVVPSRSTSSRSRRQRRERVQRTPSRGDNSPSGGGTSRCRVMPMFVFSLIVTALVFAAITMESLDRRVIGAGPKLLRDILGIVFDRSFSLKTLALTTGEAGGWDNLLMGTFALFLVFGPALRAVLCVVAMIIPATPSGHRRRFLTTINFLGAFCAWEVIVLAAYLVSLLIPSTTSTIINRPECAIVSPESGQCLTVFFDPNDYFALVIIGGVLLVIVAQLPSMIVSRRR